MSEVRYRRRGTAIVENPKGGILIARGRNPNKPFILPGGGAEKGETRFIAALRELKEETGLQPYSAEIIFTHRGKAQPTMSGRAMFQDHHTVCVVKASGRPKPNMHDVHEIDWYYANSRTWLSKTTREIIERYYRWKAKKEQWIPSNNPDENDSDIVDSEIDVAANSYDDDETMPDS